MKHVICKAPKSHAEAHPCHAQDFRAAFPAPDIYTSINNPRDKAGIVYYISQALPMFKRGTSPHEARSRNSLPRIGFHGYEIDLNPKYEIWFHDNIERFC